MIRCITIITVIIYAQGHVHSPYKGLFGRHEFHSSGFNRRCGSYTGHLPHRQRHSRRFHWSHWSPRSRWRSYRCGFPKGVIYPSTEDSFGPGKTCIHSSGIVGRCVHYTACPSLPKSQWRLNTCGYRLRDPWWCCPIDQLLEPLSPDLLPLQKTTIITTLSNTTLKPEPMNCGRRSFRKQLIVPPTTPDPETTTPMEFTPNIAGGVQAVINSWPWAALIGESGMFAPNWVCGGSLVNERWVLTSAHCVAKGELVVRLGEHDFSNPFDGTFHIDYDVREIVIPPSYDPAFDYNDFSLLKIDTVEFTPSISPICLPVMESIEASFASLIGQSLTVIGWGASEFLGPLNDVLMEANVTALNISVCENSYRNLLSFQQRLAEGLPNPAFICAGHPSADSCLGDSGGPLLRRVGEYYEQIGIVTVGYGCGNPDFPGIYSSLYDEETLNWIYTTIAG